MKKFAILENDKIINIVVANSEADLQLVIANNFIEYEENDQVFIGGTYIAEANKFILPKPFDSWLLNYETYRWEAPKLYPNDGNDYYWNENILNWELVS